MNKTLRPFLSLFLAVSLLLIGHGLQLTILPLRAVALGWSAADIGFTGSIYFLGFIAGCLSIPHFVKRAGHIRTFAAVTACCAAALLGIAMQDSLAGWSLLRFVTGWAMSGAYLLVESWLNEKSQSEMRGQVLGIYSAIVLIAMGLGQGLVAVGAPTDYPVMIVGALFLGLAVVPVSMTRSDEPAPLANARFSPRTVIATSPGAVSAALLTGCITGSIWVLAPTVPSALGFPLLEGSIVMLALILGGAVMQWPAGRISDHFDRRKVMVVLLLTGGTVALAGVHLESMWAHRLIMFIAGGCFSAIYPLALAHANDRAEDNFLELGSGILLANACGSVVGPPMAAMLMQLFGGTGFYWFIAVMSLLTVGALGVSLATREATQSHQSFQPIPQTTQEAMVLDPRSDEQSVQQPANQIQ